MSIHPGGSRRRSPVRRGLRPPTPWLAQVPTRDWERGRGAGVPAGGRSALPEEAEVVVVGAGIIGVAVAYWLARLGVPALLLEASRPGWGASGRNAGLVLGGPPSLETMRAVLDEEGIDAAYEEPGHLALAASEGVLERFRAELATRPPTATGRTSTSRRPRR